MLSSRESRELRALLQRKQRAISRRFLAEGIRVVEDLLDSPVQARWALTASSIEDSQRGRELIAALDRRGVPRRVLSDREFERYAATEAPQGVIVVADIPHASLETLDPLAPRSILLAVDAVQDPGNLGTLIRSAEAFALDAVLVLAGSVDPWNPKCVRAAAGSSFRISIVSGAPGDALSGLREAGYSILGASARGEPLSSPAPSKAVLVVGNEGAGLSAEVEAHLDSQVAIPIPGRAESLNVTAAAAILMYELSR